MFISRFSRTASFAALARAATAGGIALALACIESSQALATEFGLPADCRPGHDCFVQQYPDMDAGPSVVDPFCGTATYQGHKGTDLRLLSSPDMARGVSVVAMADGKVLRWRDGEPDRLVRSMEDRRAIASKECGNGVVIDHGGGIEVQYCHLKQGSLVVKSGETVRRGQKIGEIGASGFAQFPHVHVTVRKNGKLIDPSTGRALGDGCAENPLASDPLFSDAALRLLGQGETQVVALGLASAVLEHSALVLAGRPPPPDRNSAALVGWAWLINLRKGDQVSIEIAEAAGKILAAHTTEAMNRAKASYSAYAGKRGRPRHGSYVVTVRLMRNGAAVLTRTERYQID